MYRLQKGEPDDFPAVSATRIGNRGGRCFWGEEIENFFNPRHVFRLSSGENGRRLQEIYGFTTQDGEHLAFNRLYVGLCNAPAHFMCAIQGLFQHSINRYCQVYLDDVIIFSPNVSQHIVELRDTLFVLKKAGLKLNPAKCAFVQVKVKYLVIGFPEKVTGWIPKL